MPKRYSQLTGHPDAACAESTADPDVRTEHLERIATEIAACEALGDVALARRAGRKLLAAVAGCADLLLADGGRTLHAAPDKVGAFFDKAATGLVQSIEAMQRAAQMQAAVLEADEIAPARPRVADPLAGAIAAWAAPLLTSPRNGVPATQASRGAPRGESLPSGFDPRVGSRSDPGEGDSQWARLSETPPHHSRRSASASFEPTTAAERRLCPLPASGEREPARRARAE